MHYISANILCELYRFKKSECYLIEACNFFVDDFRNYIKTTGRLFFEIYRNYPIINWDLPIYLPRYNGDYRYAKLKIWWQEFRYRYKKILGIPKNTVFLITEKKNDKRRDN